MEGNVSSSSSSFDEEAPLFTSDYKTSANQELSNINSDPSLSPLLKHQLNRYVQDSHSTRHRSGLRIISARLAKYGPKYAENKPILKDGLASPRQTTDCLLLWPWPHSGVG